MFVSHRTDGSEPRLTAIAPAEGAARLYAHSLNPLAHAGDGLDAVSALAGRVPAYTLVSTDLPKTALARRVAVRRFRLAAQSERPRTRDGSSHHGNDARLSAAGPGRSSVFHTISNVRRVNSTSRSRPIPTHGR